MTHKQEIKGKSISLGLTSTKSKQISQSTSPLTCQATRLFLDALSWDIHLRAPGNQSIRGVPEILILLAPISQNGQAHFDHFVGLALKGLKKQ